MPRIAFYTIGILKAPYGDETVQGFMDRIKDTFTEAERSEGFIDRDRNESWGPFVMPEFFNPKLDPHVAATLSLWTDLESVCAFAYRNSHGEAFRKRREWFMKGDWPTYVAWWVEDNRTPTWEEASRRIGHIHEHGPGPFAFNFKQPFNEKGEPVELNKELLDRRISANEAQKPGI